MSDVMDAEFRESPPNIAVAADKGAPLVQQAAVMVANADAMVANLHEYERFKALAVRDNAWLTIPGVKGKYLPASEVDRIAPAMGVSWDIVSKNEDGDFGVRSKIVEAITYATKIIKKPGKGGGTYDAEVPDYTKPVKTLATLYTVTVRASDKFGRHIDIEGSFMSLEMPKSDYHSRQQALSRARRVSTLRLMGGVDEDVFEEERARIDHEKKAAAEASARVPGAGALYNRAKALSLATDGTSFRVWCKATIEACRDVSLDDWQPDLDQRVAIDTVLREMESNG